MSKFFGTLWLLFNWQRVIVYPAAFLEPRPRELNTPSDFGLPYEDVELTTKDKVKLHCYLIRDKDASTSESARGIVILFHGNAMNHGDILPYAMFLHQKNFNVFTLEYRGYGHNEGTPCEKGLCLDGQAAVDYILADPELSKLPLIIYGQSLGGAIAIHTTYKNSDKITALIIENTFTSIPDVVKGLPVLRHISFLCTQKWRSIDKMAQLPPMLPILMLSGLMDQVIPSSHMQRLWDVSEARGKPKPRKGVKGKAEHLPKTESKEDGELAATNKNKFKTFRAGTHNNTYHQPRYWDTVHEFLNDVFGPGS